ncbi:hypothetical protein TVAG_604790, partial [Trichomonas vaginalis G3]
MVNEPKKEDPPKLEVKPREVDNLLEDKPKEDNNMLPAFQHKDEKSDDEKPKEKLEIKDTEINNLLEKPKEQ